MPGRLWRRGTLCGRPRSESASGSRPRTSLPRRAPPPPPLRLYYKEAERQLTAGLGRRVTITQGKKKGKIALEYYDQEDLEGLMQALSALDTGKERRKP